MLSRRSLLTGLIAAPAVIRVAPLMRISPEPLYGVSPLMRDWYRTETSLYSNRTIRKYLDLMINPPVITYPDGTVAMFRGIPVITHEDIPVG